MAVELVSVGDAFSELGLSPELMEDAVPAYAGAIRRAVTQAQTVLRTTFDALNVTDMFLVDLAQVGGAINGYFRFRLSSGFLFGTPVVSVSDFRDGPYSVDTRALVDLRKGVISLPELALNSSALAGMFVKVEYTSGFRTKADAPKPLRDAIVSYVPQMLLSIRSVSPDAPQEANQTSRAKVMAAIAEDLLQPYHRFVGASLDPYSTVATPYA